MTRLSMLRSSTYFFFGYSFLLFLSTNGSEAAAFTLEHGHSSLTLMKNPAKKSCSLPTSTTTIATKVTLSSTALHQSSIIAASEEEDESLDNNSGKSLWKRVFAFRGGAGGKKIGLLEKYPFWSAVAITTFKSTLADLLTQCVFDKSQPWNPQRTLVFAAFGFIYQGCVQYAVVNLFWERLFPGNKPKAVFAKICGMNFLTDPLLFLPTFYIFKETMMAGFSWNTIKAALLHYKSNCFMDWRNSWMVWIPGHLVTYGVLPSHKRIPWIAFLSFFYMCILSITRGAMK